MGRRQMGQLSVRLSNKRPHLMHTHKWWHGWRTQSGYYERRKLKFHKFILILPQLLPLWLSMQMTHSLLRMISDCRSMFESTSSLSTGVAIGWMPPRLGMLLENRLFMLLLSIICLTHAEGFKVRFSNIPSSSNAYLPSGSSAVARSTRSARCPSGRRLFVPFSPRIVALCFE